MKTKGDLHKTTMMTWTLEAGPVDASDPVSYATTMTTTSTAPLPTAASPTCTVTTMRRVTRPARRRGPRWWRLRMPLAGLSLDAFDWPTHPGSSKDSRWVVKSLSSFVHQCLRWRCPDCHVLRVLSSSHSHPKSNVQPTKKAYNSLRHAPLFGLCRVPEGQSHYRDVTD